MALTMEQEFEQAKTRMMKTIVGLVTARLYVDKQMSKVDIPTFLVDKDELRARGCMVATNLVEKLESTGELEQAFNESWDSVALLLP